MTTSNKRVVATHILSLEDRRSPQWIPYEFLSGRHLYQFHSKMTF